MTNQGEKTALRFASIDWLRGFVMILMALDHVRDYFTHTTTDPMSDPNTGASLFATRWITHLCAPAFVLLSGISIGLMANRMPAAQLSGFLLTRGIWLIFLEMTVVTFAWEFNLINDPAGIILQVIWALGVAMIAMAMLIHLPRLAVLVIGLLVIVAGPQLDTVFPPATIPATDPLWMALHRQIFWQLGDAVVIVAYPVLSWVGVMACGYVLADIFTWPVKHRQRFLIYMGCGLLMIFTVFRGLNIYGDPNPWQVQADFGQTLMNFLNVSKYPASMLFLSVTLGINLMLLGFIETRRSPLHNAVVTIGRVPLFYYVLHIYLIHMLALITGVATGGQVSDWLVSSFNKPAGFGYDLWVTYLVWVAVVVMLYPACKWFAAVKARRRDWWLSYL
ncbi:DUF1624 domain-containing protein [Exilibacterium tricleocarpae]|uniref:DUF1624 domain-containing protein n=1 Tax=Exilibacterium tricleocarpae TaxID=2591008 RepID=A0A545ST67_9GAMM|nr:heparan-alpha-glucosaminide N-acetyltransferase domain-containing protein [Exilibacterium tricleocarpae]TQV68158.1 DUF1624 domain-containing protein [Exilibacterium tricleocarpae]